jgi:hypothetical protein
MPGAPYFQDDLHQISRECQNKYAAFAGTVAAFIQKTTNRTIEVEYMDGPSAHHIVFDRTPNRPIVLISFTSLGVRIYVCQKEEVIFDKVRVMVE